MPTGRPISKSVQDLKGSSVSFRISLETHALLREMARKRNTSQTEVFEIAIQLLAKKMGISQG